METTGVQSSLSDVLHVIAQSLLAPDIILLIAFILYALFSVGSVIAELFSERRYFKVVTPKFLAALMAAREEDVPTVIENSGLLKRQKEALNTVYEYRDLPGDALVALVRRLVSEEETRYDRISGRDAMAAKVAPMLGLMGTLIPLGPGVQALGQADTAALSASLLVAFDTTVAGLVTAAICLVVGKIRTGWYNDYLSALDAGMATMLEKIEDMRDPSRIIGDPDKRLADLIFATTGVDPTKEEEQAASEAAEAAPASAEPEAAAPATAEASESDAPLAEAAPAAAISAAVAAAPSVSEPPFGVTSETEVQAEAKDGAAEVTDAVSESAVAQEPAKPFSFGVASEADATLESEPAPELQPEAEIAPELEPAPESSVEPGPESEAAPEPAPEPEPETASDASESAPANPFVFGAAPAPSAFSFDSKVEEAEQKPEQDTEPVAVEAPAASGTDLSETAPETEVVSHVPYFESIAKPAQETAQNAEQRTEPLAAVSPTEQLEPVSQTESKPQEEGGLFKSLFRSRPKSASSADESKNE